MRLSELENLLLRLSEGQASSADLLRAKQLLREDTRLPEDLRALPLEQEISMSAGLLFAVLTESSAHEVLGAAVRAEAGPSPMLHLPMVETQPLLDAVAFEAGPIDLAEGVMTSLGVASPVPLAEALRAELDLSDETLRVDEAVLHEAGEVDVTGGVFAALGLGQAPVAAAVREEASLEEAFSLELAEAVVFEAGSIELASAVMQAVDEAEVPVSDAIIGEAGLSDVAAAVLATLGHEALPVAAVVVAEAGTVDVADAVCAKLSDEAVLPLAETIASLAGPIDLSDTVMSELGETSSMLAAALSDEAGTIEVAAAVMGALRGANPVPVAEAIRDEAGSVDVVAQVEALVSPAWLSAMLDHELEPAAHRMAARRLREQPNLASEMTSFANLGRELRASVEQDMGETPSMWADVAQEIGVANPEEVPGYDESLLQPAVAAEAGDVDVAADVMSTIRRSALVPGSIDVPEAANERGWTWGAVALAAIALIAVMVGQMGLPEFGGTQNAAPVDALEFASAEEIVVDDLTYDEDTFVQVIQAEAFEGDGGALIIWVDEEA